MELDHYSATLEMANHTNNSNLGDSVSAVKVGTDKDNGTGRSIVKQVICGDYLQCVADYIFLVSNPIITVVSVLSNILTLVVMSRRSLRHNAIAVHLSALAVSDSLVLLTDVLSNWLRTVTGINLIGTSDEYCKFHRFFFNVVYTYSAWIVTSLGVERFIVVWFPLQAKRICSYRNSVINVVLLPLPIVALYLYNLWAWFADDDQQCEIVGQWSEFQSNVGPLLSAFAYSYIPVVVLVSLNAAIIGRLSLARNRRRQMSTDASASEKRETRLTVTIVVICVFYVIMTVPLSIYYTLVFRIGKFLNMNSRLYFIRVIINMVSACSYGTTFFLYVLTSGGFRQHLRDIFGCCQRSHCCCALRSTELMEGGGGGEGGGVDAGGAWSMSQITIEEELGVSVMSSSNSSSATIPNSERRSSKIPDGSEECTAF